MFLWKRHAVSSRVPSFFDTLIKRETPTPMMFGAGVQEALPAAGTYSSLSLSLLMTAKSSRVVMSPLTSPLVASSRSRRRMILPERVFGS